MADIVYGVTLNNVIFEGELVDKQFHMMKTVLTKNGQRISMIGSHKLYDTPEERNISIFLDSTNRSLSLYEVAKRYNLSIEEIEKAYETAFEKFLEKFI